MIRKKMGQDTVVFFLGGGGVGEVGGTKKQILNYSKLQQIGMWTILQRIMSTLRHSYVREPDVVWHKVKGTR